MVGADSGKVGRVDKINVVLGGKFMHCVWQLLHFMEAILVKTLVGTEAGCRVNKTVTSWLRCYDNHSTVVFLASAQVVYVVLGNFGWTGVVEKAGVISAKHNHEIIWSMAIEQRR